MRKYILETIQNQGRSQINDLNQDITIKYYYSSLNLQFTLYLYQGSSMTDFEPHYSDQESMPSFYSYTQDSSNELYYNCISMLDDSDSDQAYFAEKNIQQLSVAKELQFLKEQQNFKEQLQSNFAHKQPQITIQLDLNQEQKISPKKKLQSDKQFRVPPQCCCLTQNQKHFDHPSQQYLNPLSHKDLDLTFPKSEWLHSFGQISNISQVPSGNNDQDSLSLDILQGKSAIKQSFLRDLQLKTYEDSGQSRQPFSHSQISFVSKRQQFSGNEKSFEQQIISLGLYQSQRYPSICYRTEYHGKIIQYVPKVFGLSSWNSSQSQKGNDQRSSIEHYNLNLQFAFGRDGSRSPRFENFWDGQQAEISKIQNVVHDQQSENDSRILLDEMNELRNLIIPGLQDNSSIEMKKTFSQIDSLEGQFAFDFTYQIQNQCESSQSYGEIRQLKDYIQSATAQRLGINCYKEISLDIQNISIEGTDDREEKYSEEIQYQSEVEVYQRHQTQFQTSNWDSDQDQQPPRFRPNISSSNWSIRSSEQNRPDYHSRNQSQNLRIMPTARRRVQDSSFNFSIEQTEFIQTQIEYSRARNSQLPYQRLGLSDQSILQEISSQSAQSNSFELGDQSLWQNSSLSQLGNVQGFVSYRPMRFFVDSNESQGSIQIDSFKPYLPNLPFRNSYEWYFSKNYTFKVSQITKKQLQQLEQCPICYENLAQPINPQVKPDLTCQTTHNEGHEITRLFCRHLFHKKCIKKWIFHSKPNCPICRKDFRDHKQYTEKKVERLWEKSSCQEEYSWELTDYF